MTGLLGFAVVTKGNRMTLWARCAAVCCGALLADGVPTKTRAAEAGNNNDRSVAVDAPSTQVEVRGSKKTRVKVRAPHTAVDVNTRRRRVRIDATFTRAFRPKLLLSRGSQRFRDQAITFANRAVGQNIEIASASPMNYHQVIGRRSSA